MVDGNILNYVRSCVQSDPLDMETAKKIILEHLHVVSQATFEPVSSSQLISQVVLQKQTFSHAISVEAGYEPALDDEITRLRAILAAREALLSLHADGVLIPYGALIIGNGHVSEETNLVLKNVHPNSPYGGFNTQIIGPIHLPSVYSSYRIAAFFREDQMFRLASGDIYLSTLNQAILPSRAKRCLRECINAFRFGLYLSANMSIGAASESLWMQMSASLRRKKPSVTTELGKQLDRKTPSIAAIIDEAWQVLNGNFTTELDQILVNKTGRSMFKDQANRLCDRRNYAMHSEDANEDEPYFTRIETGMLLLDSISYFNQLTKLIAAIEASH